MAGRWSARATEGGARDKKFERALTQIGEHLGIGAELAFRKHVEPQRAIGLLADRLSYLREAFGGWAADRLIEPKPVVKARCRVVLHWAIIIEA